MQDHPAQLVSDYPKFNLKFGNSDRLDDFISNYLRYSNLCNERGFCRIMVVGGNETFNNFTKVYTNAIMNKIIESQNLDISQRNQIYKLIENNFKIYLVPDNNLNSIVNYLSGRDCLYSHECV